MNQEKHAGVAEEICKRFKLTRLNKLGSGAFKEAYLVTKDNHSFALKIASVSQELKPRLEREIDVLKRCNHSAIAKIIASDTFVFDNKEYWIIIEEYLSLGTLSYLNQQNSLNLDQIRHLGVTLVGALAHLHLHGFVHRDIKPANILFRTYEEPVLTDFGIVRMLGETSLTQDFLAQGPGTPMYASPEQLLNEKEGIDWRTDQFGLALVLSEQILGHHAYSRDLLMDPRDAISSVASRQPIPDSNQELLRAKGFECLIKAMSPWAVQRYRKPADFLSALEKG